MFPSFSFLNYEHFVGVQSSAIFSKLANLIIDLLFLPMNNGRAEYDCILFRMGCGDFGCFVTWVRWIRRRDGELS
jgi:hypothetical protein